MPILPETRLTSTHRLTVETTLATLGSAPGRSDGVGTPRSAHNLSRCDPNKFDLGHVTARRCRVQHADDVLEGRHERERVAWGLLRSGAYDKRCETCTLKQRRLRLLRRQVFREVDKLGTLEERRGACDGVVPAVCLGDGRWFWPRVGSRRNCRAA